VKLTIICLLQISVTSTVGPLSKGNMISTVPLDLHFLKQHNLAVAVAVAVCRMAVRFLLLPPPV
jgi:hypothetical protein